MKAGSWTAVAVWSLLSGAGLAAEQVPAAVELNNQGVQAAQAGRFEEAVRLLRQGLALAPVDENLQQNLVMVLLDWGHREIAQGRWAQAVPLLEEAVKLGPEQARAWALLGNIYYATRPELSVALEAWKRGYPALSGAEQQLVAARIAQAERDVRLERTFAGRETPHFVLRAEQATAPETLDQLEKLLEATYAQLQAAFGRPLSARVTVLLYGGSAYQRVAGRKDWSLGLYDGRIRLRLDELSAEQLPAVLAHELTHAYLTTLYGPFLPLWIQEGLAQVHEPPQPLTPRQQEVRDALVARTGWIPLSWVERRFEQPGHPEDLERAYMESRLVMETLIAQHGMAPVRAWLAALSRGDEVGPAFEQAFPGRRWARVEQGALQP